MLPRVAHLLDAAAAAAGKHPPTAEQGPLAPFPVAAEAVPVREHKRLPFDSDV
jgi:hypothetical protein